MTAIDCGPLVKEWNIENGMIFGRDTYCGSVLKFKCFEGFQLIGSRSVSCRENGKWSEDKPDCRRECLDFHVSEFANRLFRFSIFNHIV